MYLYNLLYAGVLKNEHEYELLNMECMCVNPTMFGQFHNGGRSFQRKDVKLAGWKGTQFIRWI